MWFSIIFILSATVLQLSVKSSGKTVKVQKKQKKIIIFDAVGKELFFGFYSKLIDNDEKILKLFPDAETKRIYFCNHNNSIGILLPEEKINK